MFMFGGYVIVMAWGEWGERGGGGVSVRVPTTKSEGQKDVGDQIDFFRPRSLRA